MDDILTDDHVAEMLAKEANDYSLKYSSTGLEANRSSRPAAKAKPNIRFLQNIVKETKNHNEALLAKEAAESQARLESLAQAKAKEERKHRPGAQDIRRRQLGAITATLQGRKRKAPEGDTEDLASRKRDLVAPKVHRDSATRQERATDRPDRAVVDEPERAHRRGRDRETETEVRRRRHRSTSYDTGKASKSLSRREENRSKSPGHKERRERHSHRYRHRSRDTSLSSGTDKGTARHNRHISSRHRDRSQGDDSSYREKHRSSRHRDRSQDNNEHPSSPRNKHRHRQRDDESERIQEKQDDSDPLEAIIGPIPPPSPKIRRKGRGNLSGPSAMDSRFSESYDPKADIQPDSDLEGDDWEDSLEALRDREKWKRQGAERLRAAGFTEEQVGKWEKNDGREKGVEDVKWVKSGEREWDRGKVVGGTDEGWSEEGRLNEGRLSRD